MEEFASCQDPINVFFAVPNHESSGERDWRVEHAISESATLPAGSTIGGLHLPTKQLIKCCPEGLGVPDSHAHFVIAVLVLVLNA